MDWTIGPLDPWTISWTIFWDLFFFLLDHFIGGGGTLLVLREGLDVVYQF